MTNAVELGRERGRRVGSLPFPWLTLAAVLVMAGFFAWQLADNHVLDALRRDPDGLQWTSAYRVLTALLVQSDGWGQAIYNLFGLLVFGVAIEWVWPRWAWLALFLSAGIVGQVLGYAWAPPGGGNSVAVCGLVGAVIAIMFIGGPTLPPPALIFAAYYPALLLGLHVTNQAVAIIVTAVAVSVVIVISRRRPGRQLALWRALAGLLVVEAVALAAYRDHHGPALLTGVAVGALLTRAVPEPVSGH